MSIFKTQSLLSLVLETGYTNLVSATVKRILYQKPDGQKGYWDASITGTTKLLYDIQNGDIDQAGTWKFHSYIEVAGKKGFGDIASVLFNEPLV